MKEEYKAKIEVDYTKEINELTKELKDPEKLKLAQSLYGKDNAEQVIENTLNLMKKNIRASALLEEVFTKELGLKPFVYDANLQIGNYYVDFPKDENEPRQLFQVINVKAGMYNSMNITSNVLRYISKEMGKRPKDLVIEKEDFQALKKCKILTVKKIEDMSSKTMRVQISSQVGKIASVLVMGRFIVIDYVIDFNFTNNKTSDIILGKITYDTFIGNCAYNVFMPIPSDILNEIKRRYDLWEKQAQLELKLKKETKKGK